MRDRQPGAALTLAVSAALISGACASVRLAELPVATVEASLEKPEGLLPGESSRLIAVVTTTDGREFATRGKGRPRASWKNFDLESELLPVGTDGTFRMPDDPRQTEGRSPRVRIAVKGHPHVSTEVAVPIRYDGRFVSDFSGWNGGDGPSGLSGSSGSSGSTGSIDPAHPSAGGDGGDGGDGGSGWNGGAGGNGEDVRVWMALREGPTPLLQVRVAGTMREDLFLVDPRGGTLLVRTDGGHGGRGGPGGKGGKGGSGGMGSPSGKNGRDGRDGHPGRDGPGGTGGAVTVYVDPRAEPYLDALQISNGAGWRGRAGPSPHIRVQPVPPLW
jgi:hypothetical protein